MAERLQPSTVRRCLLYCRAVRTLAADLSNHLLQLTPPNNCTYRTYRRFPPRGPDASSPGITESGNEAGEVGGSPPVCAPSAAAALLSDCPVPPPRSEPGPPPLGCRDSNCAIISLHAKRAATLRPSNKALFEIGIVFSPLRRLPGALGQAATTGGKEPKKKYYTGRSSLR